jgi:predicted dehydrogenase
LWGAREAYGSMDDMLAQADVEAVFVLTSMASHATLALKAAQAGKHFLVQKPFATDMQEGLAVVETARNAGVKVLVEPNYWHDPVYRKAKEIIEEGHIGAVRYILGRTERDFVPLWGGPTFYEREGGGMLFDMGVYIVSALTYLLGPAIRVAGMAAVSSPESPPIFTDDVFTEFLQSYEAGDNPTTYMSEGIGTVPATMEAPDNTFALIEWPNDCLACVIASSVSFVMPPAGPRLFLCGEKRTIAFGIPNSGSRLSVATVDKDSPYHVSDRRRGGQVGWYHSPGYFFPAWRYTAGSTQHLHDCIVQDAAPVPSMDWGMHVSEIMIKSFQSAGEQRALDLATAF